MIDPNATKPEDMLAQIHELYRWTALELIRMVNALKDGSSTDAKGTAQFVRDLRVALGWAIDEKINVEKIGRTLAAHATAQSGAGLDLDAARNEIGGRLARLRAARDDG
jgi:hypothetical protein